MEGFTVSGSICAIYAGFACTHFIPRLLHRNRLHGPIAKQVSVASIFLIATLFAAGSGIREAIVLALFTSVISVFMGWINFKYMKKKGYEFD